MAERILVVEDDPRMADLLRRGLIFEGYQVEQAGDGETALPMAWKSAAVCAPSVMCRS
jgi:DNA-binding response OmpR family regulator